MFCKNCGKDIGDAKFCQYCGSSNEEKQTNITVNLIQEDFVKKIKEKIFEIGHEKLLKLTSLIATIISIIVRIAKNEIETVYGVVLTQDDYFVISDIGRKYMIVVILIQLAISVLLYNNAKKAQAIVSKKTLLLVAASIIIQIFAMILRLPAPY